MPRYIPGACLLVADRPQTPVKPGASAPGFLSRLRRLLLPAGREKSSTRLLLAVTIFLFTPKIRSTLFLAVSSSIIFALACLYSGYRFLFSAYKVAYSCCINRVIKSQCENIMVYDFPKSPRSGNLENLLVGGSFPLAPSALKNHKISCLDF